MLLHQRNYLPVNLPKHLLDLLKLLDITHIQIVEELAQELELQNPLLLRLDHFVNLGLGETQKVIDQFVQLLLEEGRLLNQS